MAATMPMTAAPRMIDPSGFSRLLNSAMVFCAPLFHMSSYGLPVLVGGSRVPLVALPPRERISALIALRVVLAWVGPLSHVIACPLGPIGAPHQFMNAAAAAWLGKVTLCHTVGPGPGTVKVTGGPLLTAVGSHHPAPPAAATSPGAPVWVADRVKPDPQVPGVAPVPVPVACRLMPGGIPLAPGIGGWPAMPVAASMSVFWALGGG